MKGAIPLILILFVSLFVIWLLLIPPQDVESLLPGVFGEENNSNVNTLFSQDLGYVGVSNGDVIKRVTFSDVSLNYPLFVNHTYLSDQVMLTSNILQASSLEKSFNTNDNQLKNIVLKFNVGKPIGSPIIEVKYNDNVKYSSSAIEGQNVSIIIPKNEFNGTDKLKITCYWQGFAFWSSQTCVLNDVDIYLEKYDPKQPVDVKEFDLSKNEADAGNIHLVFRVLNSSGKINISINNVKLHSGELNSILTYVKESTANSVGLSEGTNVLSFSAYPGSYFNIDDIRLIIYNKNLNQFYNTINFNIPQSIYQSKNKFYLSFNIESIYKLGNLTIIFPNGNLTLKSTDYSEGLNKHEISKSLLNIGYNTISFTTNGLLKVGNVKLTY